MRKLGFIILFIILSLLNPRHATAASDELLEQWRKMPLDELMQLGRNYANQANNADSALACFRMVSMCFDPAMSRADKELCARALNNCGLIYTLNQFDYQKAYTHLSRALELCQAYQLDDALTIVYLNLGNLYSHCNHFIESASALQKAREYYRKSRNLSLETQNWGVFVTATLNSYNCSKDTADLIPVLNPAIPDSTASLGYARNLLSVLRMLEAHDYQGARRYLMADEQAEATSYTSLRHYLSRKVIEADSYKDEGKTDSCIMTLNSVLAYAEDTNQRDAQVILLNKLAEVYAQMGDSIGATQYYFKYYQRREALAKESGLGTLIETEMLQQIEDEEVHIQRLTLERERHRLWLAACGLIICAIMVITVIILYKNRQLKLRNRMLYQKTQELIAAEQTSREMRRTMPATEIVDDLTRRIEILLDDPDIICQQDFTMARLAQLADSNTSYVSKVINQNYGKSFSILLGDCRVKEACRRLADFEHFGHLTIEAISESVGFKSRTTFLTAFKRSIGMSPSEYQKMAIEQHQKAI